MTALKDAIASAIDRLAEPALLRRAQDEFKEVK
jgi:hypothetical protein